MPDLSIIVVTYNSGEIALDCLDSLVTASLGLATEIIIVDNNSQDGTPERIQERFPQVRLLSNPDNLGFASANNSGLSVALGRYLLLVNPDVIVEPNTLKLMIEYLEAEPQVGIVGPRTIDGQGNIALTVRGKFTPFTLLWHYWGLNGFLPVEQYQRQSKKDTAPFEATWLQASCLMFRREVYEQVGGLDTGFFMFCEEPDFCERAAQSGWHTVYVPQARVTHFESTTVSRYPLLKMRNYHLSPLYYFRKRHRPLSVLVLKFGFILELSVKYLLRVIQNALNPHDSLRMKIQAYPIVIKEIWRY